MRVSTFKSLLFVATLSAVASTTTAQTYPVKPVRMIVSSGPGSFADTAARIFSAKLAELWGQQVLIENVAGAAGNIGAERVAKSAPDGYTLLYATAGPLQFNMSLYSKLGYDIVGDFDPITQVSRAPNILAVHPSVPANSVQELIAYARANPGKLRFGSPGSGSSQHLSGELFKKMTGVDMVHVPYKSSAQMTLELVAGQFELTFQNAPTILPYVKRGQVRALAVTAADRMPFAHELPTVAESGLAGFEIGGRAGLLAPKGTPASIINKVHADMARVMAIPSVREHFAANGLVIVASTPEQFATSLKHEINRWAPIIKASGAKVD
jgi:tripartite-type tricarboxylate transporter receptor subunit TctC